MEVTEIRGESVLLQDNIILISFNDEQAQAVSIFAKVKADPQSIYNAAGALFDLHPELTGLFFMAAGEALKKQ